MFASLIKTLFKKSSVKNESPNFNEPQYTTGVVTLRQDVENMLFKVKEIDFTESAPSKESISDSFELLSIADSLPEDLNENDSYELKSEINSDEETVQDPVENTIKEPVEDRTEKNDTNIAKEMNSLECIFTWKLKSYKRNIISRILNEYGDYNLDISLPEFSLKRFIGNLIIGYELFHNGEIENAQMKILKIGKWLEELDNGSDNFYLSISTGLYHIMKGTFIHMLFASNLFEECKWLLDDIIPYIKMSCKSKASIHAVHAAVLTEYSRNAHCYKKACELANKACVLDPSSPYWFYIYAVVLSKQRIYLHTYKSNPTENEINAIQHAIMLSDGKNTVFNYHRILLDKDTATRNYHDNINVKNNDIYEKNLNANLKIVEMIKTVISMEPKDPLVIVGCAKILMTLPTKVRNFDLGKMYLTKAMQMAPNDVAVLNSIEKAIIHYKRISNKKYENKKTLSKQFQPSFKNKKSKITEKLSFLVNEHKNGKDPLPDLIAMLDKFNGRDKVKIIAQICSYTILFANNLRAGVEHFMMLLEEPRIINDNLIIKHYSSFGSKTFNLADLICNEIRLATNSCKTPSEEMLFYFKALTTIMETFKLEMKEVDSSMKSKLIVGSTAKSPCLSAIFHSESNLSDNNSVVDQSENMTNKSSKPKKFQNIDSKIFKAKSRGNKKKDINTSNAKKYNLKTNFADKSHASNTSDIDQIKSKMTKFLSSSETVEFSNHASLKIKNIGALQTQEEIGQYSQMLYQHISNNKSQQNPSSANLNTYPHQNSKDSNNSFQSSLPSSLNIKTQINPRFLPSTNRNHVNKKK